MNELRASPPSPPGDLANRSVPAQTSYLDVAGELVYCVRQPAADARGLVLLAGPFAADRPNSHIPWVRWARFLASRGFDTVRFDYRGVGESTGSFTGMSLATWAEDVEAVARWMGTERPGRPLLLHGLGLGALLSAAVFKKGVGDALLMWSAPESGIEALRDGLKRQLAMDYTQPAKGARRTFADYEADLEAGKEVEVEGYTWSRQLWQSAGAYDLTGLDVTASCGSPTPARSWKHIRLEQKHAPLVAGMGQFLALTLNPVLKKVPLSPDLSSFYMENLKWIEEALSRRP